MCNAKQRKKLAEVIFAVSLMMSSCERKKIANQFEKTSTPIADVSKKGEKSSAEIFFIKVGA
ncbi:MAG: hypothetical protein LBV62_01960 [Rickettsiales bacterium]|jgi:hypothetical protein|nr:hypothetical protein [Rickettsiales bacterium]